MGGGGGGGGGYMYAHVGFVSKGGRGGGRGGTQVVQAKIVEGGGGGAAPLLFTTPSGFHTLITLLPKHSTLLQVVVRKHEMKAPHMYDHKAGKL